MLYSLLEDARYTIATAINYVDIYSRLAEAQSSVALTVALLLLLRFLLLDRSWLSLLGAIYSLALAKWLARGVWIESAILKPGALDGRTIVVVGASRGIGLYVAKQLVRTRPKRLIVGIRGDDGRVQRIVELIRNQSDTNVMGFSCDLNDLQSVVRFINSVKSEVNDEAVDCLICNAGCLAPVDWRDHKLTPDGFEMSWQSNILGHYLISEELIPLLMKSKQPRLIHMSSIAHTWTLQKIDYSRLTRVSRNAEEHHPVTLYAWSKLAQIYHVQDLHERYGNKGLIACAVHPGIVRTEIHEKGVSPILGGAYKVSQYFTGKSILEGAQTTLYCALSPDVLGGQWYHDCKPCQPSLIAQDIHERKQCLHWLAEARRSATPRSLSLRSVQ